MTTQAGGSKLLWGQWGVDFVFMLRVNYGRLYGRPCGRPDIQDNGRDTELPVGQTMIDNSNSHNADQTF